MKLTKLTTGHDEFISWLRMVFPGCTIREFTDAFGTCVEVIEECEGYELVREVYAVPATVYHNPSEDAIWIVPQVNDRQFALTSVGG